MRIILLLILGLFVIGCQSSYMTRECCDLAAFSLYQNNYINNEQTVYYQQLCRQQLEQIPIGEKVPFECLRNIDAEGNYVYGTNR